MSRNSVTGKTLRFTFKDGPMAGKTFEHVFEQGGAVRFRQGDGNATTVPKYEAATIGPDVSAVSYLGPSGYVLTAVLDYRTKTLVAFSSNEKTLLLQHGTFEEIDAAPATAHHGSGGHEARRN